MLVSMVAASRAELAKAFNASASEAFSVHKRDLPCQMVDDGTASFNVIVREGI
jgi:hypothetical protein